MKSGQGVDRDWMSLWIVDWSNYLYSDDWKLGVQMGSHPMFGVPIPRRAIESYLLLLPLCCSGTARHVSLYSRESNFCPGRGWYPMYSHPLFVQGEIAGLILA